MNEYRDERIRRAVEQTTAELADKGKLIEGGFAAMVAAVGKPLFEGCHKASEITERLKLLRLVYLAGAQHLFHSMTSIVSEGDEITEQDDLRMQKINDELCAVLPELWRFADKDSKKGGIA